MPLFLIELKRGVSAAQDYIVSYMKGLFCSGLDHLVHLKVKKPYWRPEVDWSYDLAEMLLKIDPKKSNQQIAAITHLDSGAVAAIREDMVHSVWKQVETKAETVAAITIRRAETEAAKIIKRAETEAAKTIKRAEAQAAKTIERAEVKAEAQTAKIIQRVEARAVERSAKLEEAAKGCVEVETKAIKQATAETTEPSARIARMAPTKQPKDGDVTAGVALAMVCLSEANPLAARRARRLARMSPQLREFWNETWEA